MVVELILEIRLSHRPAQGHHRNCEALGTGCTSSNSWDGRYPVDHSKSANRTATKVFDDFGDVTGFVDRPTALIRFGSLKRDGFAAQMAGWHSGVVHCVSGHLDDASTAL
jgi:hypothetical protein